MRLQTYFQGLPSAVLHDSATTMRSGTGPPYTQIIPIGACDWLMK